MPEFKLGKIKFLRIRTDTDVDAVYALGSLRAVRIESVIGEVYRPSHAVGRIPDYIESVIAINEEHEEEAIDILRHLSMVHRLWKQKVSYDTIIQLETEYTRGLREEFLPEHRMPR